MDSVIEVLQLIELDYKTVNDCPENDCRLNYLHKWWLDHPDIREKTVYQIYRDGEYLMTGTAKEIAQGAGFASTSTVYNFKSKAYTEKEHHIKYELIEANADE